MGFEPNVSPRYQPMSILNDALLCLPDALDKAAMERVMLAGNFSFAVQALEWTLIICHNQTKTIFGITTTMPMRCWSSCTACFRIAAAAGFTKTRQPRNRFATGPT